MKKTGFLTVLIFCFLICHGQNISVTFTGKGAATQVDSVTATNLSTNQRVTLPGNETLVLTGKTGIQWISDLANTGIVYPNPFSGGATVLFSTKVSQTIHIRVQNLLGQIVAQTNAFIPPGENEFDLCLNTAGIYMVSFTSEQGTISYKVICTDANQQENSIVYRGSSSNNQNNQNNHNNQNIAANAGLKTSQTTFTLGYTRGERILYKCFSGIYTSVLTDSPVVSKNYEVEFVACTDRDNRNYSVVKVGDQFWMAENLAYLPRVSPANPDFGATTGFYVYGYNGTTVQYAKAASNYTVYGVLYDWATAKNSCPAGWHLPTKSEWGILLSQLGPPEIAGKNLKETGSVHWTGTNGNATNLSGFSALPGGERYPFVSGYMGLTVYPDFRNLGNNAAFWSCSEMPLFYHPESLSAWYLSLSGGIDGYGWNSEHAYGMTHYWYPSQTTKTSGYSVRCLLGEPPTSPKVTTMDIIQITDSSAQSGGIIVSDGGQKVLNKGICWSVSPEPTIKDSLTKDVSGKDSFVSSITGLKANTTYYVRAWAENEIGIGYGNEISFLTKPGLPVLTSSMVIQITDFSAIGGGNVLNDGGSEITHRGVCWSTSRDPSLNDPYTTDGTGKGSYISRIPDLQSNTTYFARAYATNVAGTIYGENIQFRTAQGSFPWQGRVYGYVTIGTQTWMNENLAYLPAVSPLEEESPVDPKYYVYDYNGNQVSEAQNTMNYMTYGVLYNRIAALNGAPPSENIPSGVRGICPDGWHVPSRGEFEILITYVGEEAAALKSRYGWTEWGNGDNSSGFNALPGGYRHYWGFSFINSTASFWTTTNDNNNTPLTLQIFSYTSFWDDENPAAMSVRCIKNKQGQNSPPIADFSISSDIGAPGLSVRFNATTSYDSETPISGLLFKWDWNSDGTWDTENNHDSQAVHIFSNSGNYTVLLQVTDADGAVNTATKMVTIADGSFTDDRDRNAYVYVRYGTQTWMAENMKYLPLINTVWESSFSEPRYYVNGSWSADPDQAKQYPAYKTYGVLYNREASKTACPAGWHLPTDDEWIVLEKYLGMSDGDVRLQEWRATGNVGKKLKATTGWEYEGNGDNTSRFLARPGGNAYNSGSQSFADPGMTCDFWTSTSQGTTYTMRRRLIYLNNAVLRNPEPNDSGLSIRCVKD
jgi:uncharacterized protein (TIGR02145 family)